MADYWVTFRLKDDSTYKTRYQAMLDAMIEARGSYASWGEPTSFWLVRSTLGIDAFVRKLTEGLNARTDLFVCRVLGANESRYFGNVEHPSILKAFLPDIKKLP